MTGRELLERAKADGLTVEAKDGMIHLRGPQPKRQHWKAVLMPHKTELLLELGGVPCVRCGASGVRLVPTYWSRWTEGICPACVPAQVEQFDQDGWPPPPWGDIRPSDALAPSGAPTTVQMALGSQEPYCGTQIELQGTVTAVPHSEPRQPTNRTTYRYTPTRDT